MSKLRIFRLGQDQHYLLSKSEVATLIVPYGSNEKSAENCLL